MCKALRYLLELFLPLTNRHCEVWSHIHTHSYLSSNIIPDAKAGGHASTATAVVRKKMAADEAAKILNVEIGAGKEIVEKVCTEQQPEYIEYNTSVPAI